MIPWAQVLFKGSPPLFDSQREVARFLCEERGFGREKLSSTAVFLSQVVNGRRPLPKDWKPHLLAVVERRARERGEDVQEIHSMLDLRLDVNPLARLIAEQQTAHDVLILNACPLELTDARHAHAEAAALQDLVVSGLLTGRRYRYGVAGRISAERLWSALLQVTSDKLGTEAASHVRDWTQRGSLTVCIVPELLLLHPTVAYNTGTPDRLSAFVWHAPYDWERCLPIPDRQVAGWFGKVQDILDTSSELVPFSN